MPDGYHCQESASEEARKKERVMENILNYLQELFMSNGIAIAVGSFVIGEMIKKTELIDNKWIPLIGGGLGCVLGAVVPSFFPDTNIVVATINGLALGWAATGGYETFRNLKAGK